MGTRGMMHWLGRNDRVQEAATLRLGEVADEGCLYVTVRWDDGVEEVRDQHDPRLIVLERAATGSTALYGEDRLALEE